MKNVLRLLVIVSLFVCGLMAAENKITNYVKQTQELNKNIQDLKKNTKDKNKEFEEKLNKYNDSLKELNKNIINELKANKEYIDKNDFYYGETSLNAINGYYYLSDYVIAARGISGATTTEVSDSRKIKINMKDFENKEAFLNFIENDIEIIKDKEAKTTKGIKERIEYKNKNSKNKADINNELKNIKEDATKSWDLYKKYNPRFNQN